MARGISKALLHDLGLPQNADEVEDSIEGGIAAYQAWIPCGELWARGKDLAAKGYFIAQRRNSNKRYVAPWPENKRSALLADYHAGVSKRDLAVKYDLASEFSVDQALKRYGVKKQKTLRYWTDHEDDMLLELMYEGSSCEEIAAAIRRTPLATAGRANRLGYPEMLRKIHYDRYRRPR